MCSGFEAERKKRKVEERNGNEQEHFDLAQLLLGFEGFVEPKSIIITTTSKRKRLKQLFY